MHGIFFDINSKFLAISLAFRRFDINWGLLVFSAISDGTKS